MQDEIRRPGEIEAARRFRVETHSGHCGMKASVSSPALERLILGQTDVETEFINTHSFHEPTHPLALGTKFHRIVVTKLDAPSDPEYPEVCAGFLRAQQLRKKYQSPLPAADSDCKYKTAWQNGVVAVSVSSDSSDDECAMPPSYEEFAADLHDLHHFAFMHKQSNTLAYRRLKILELQFDYHKLLNQRYEEQETKLTNCDFFSVPKVDNHIHAAAAITSKEFLEFVQLKAETDADVPMLIRTDPLTNEQQQVTLRQVLQKHGVHIAKDGDDPEEDRITADMLSSGGGQWQELRQERPDSLKDLHARENVNSERNVNPADRQHRRKLRKKGSGSGLTADMLDMEATAKVFRRFDNFNDTYNPLADPDLRTIFLKTSNLRGGQYFAELLKLAARRVAGGASATSGESGNRGSFEYWEPRLSIYGKSKQEWRTLSDWVIRHGLIPGSSNGNTNANANANANGSGDLGHAHAHVRFMVQIPRLFGHFKKSGLVQDFQEVLSNIFDPLFEATLHPEEHPNVARFLSHLGGFDCVDDESVSDPLLLNRTSMLHSRAQTQATSPTAPSPSQYSQPGNPPYSYFLYYIYANLASLNRLRCARGLNSFPFKPHCGEAGEAHHLCTGFLLADSINHGIMLEREAQAQPTNTMQYLYYLEQIGLAMCPLSNDSLFVPLPKSPIGKLFRRGLRVALGTDDPLQFHSTLSPLLEEYTTAKRMFRLDNMDLCEMARNSCLISTFPESTKRAWHGSHYADEKMHAANDPDLTNVPQIRTAYRDENLDRERHYVRSLAAKYEALPRARPHRLALLAHAANGVGKAQHSQSKPVLRKEGAVRGSNSLVATGATSKQRSHTDSDSDRAHGGSAGFSPLADVKDSQPLRKVWGQYRNSKTSKQPGALASASHVHVVAGMGLAAGFVLAGVLLGVTWASSSSPPRK